MNKTIEKIVESKYAPKQTNVIWLDVSGNKPVKKSYINGKWVIIGSGNINYSYIIDKPQINGVELDGNKTTEELGISTMSMIETTYEELRELRDNSQLTPGAWYRITDYTCTTAQANTQSAGHVFDIIVRADDVNHLNENAFAALHEGDTYFSNCQLESWKLKYCIDNDTTKFKWADDRMQLSLSFQSPLSEINTTADLVTKDTRWKWKIADNNTFIYTEPNPTSESVIYAFTTGTSEVPGTINSVDSPGKGVVYFMKDEWDNECPYDFKNILFQRWAVDDIEPASGYTLTQDALDSLIQAFVYDEESQPKRFAIQSSDYQQGPIQFIVDDSNSDYYYTFNWINEEGDIMDASVNAQNIQNDEGGYYGVTKNTIASCNAGVIGAAENPTKLCFGLNNIVFMSDYVFEDGVFYGVYGINIAGDCYSMTFGNYNESMSFGNNNCNLSFGNGCGDMSFGNYNESMTFANSNGNLSFGNECGDMSFGNNNKSMSFGNNNGGLSFGNNNKSMTFGNHNGDMLFGNDNYEMTFGNYNSGLSFENNNGGLSFGNYNGGLSFGNNNESMSFENSNESMTFGNSNESMSFENSNFNLSFGNNNKSMTFGNSNFNLSFGNDNGNLSFGNSNLNLSFGNGCGNLSFGNHNDDMSFENSNFNLSFGNDNYEMTFGNSNYNMSFGNGCGNLSFVNICGMMSFGNNNKRLSFGNENYDMSFGNSNFNMSFGNNIRYITVFDGAGNCDVTGTDSGYVQYAQILNSVGSNGRVTINFAKDKMYTQVAGLDNSGNLVIWNPADQHPT